MAVFLVIQAARFGDLVQTKRLLLSLARQGSVHLAVDSSLIPLARLLYPFAELHGLPVHGSPSTLALGEVWRVLSRWRGMPVDAVYNCNYAGMTAALCRVFPPEIVYGYRPENGGIARSPWARVGFRLSTRRASTPLNLVDFWAYFTTKPVPPTEVMPQPQAGGRGLGVVLAGRESRRSLPTSLLAALVRTASGSLHKAPIYLFGTSKEKSVARRLVRELPTPLLRCVNDLTGKTDWSALLDALTGLDALITPDTGTMHLAAHAGVPVLAFFLSSAWLHETGPYGQGHFVWQTVRPCSPCLESAPCPYETACRLPLAETAVQRSLAAVLDHKTSLPSLPAGLQLWQTCTDALGSAPRLLVGEDPNAVPRAAARAWIGARLGVSTTGDVPPFSADMREWLLAETDWMLPPERYC